MAQTNMYRVTVGDFVYFETSTPSAPFVIRKIEELTMTPSKNVEARCLCFYRRRDLPQSLVQMADKYATFYDDCQDEDSYGGQTGQNGPAVPLLSSPRKQANGREELLPRQIYQLKHRELFISRTVECLPATAIRGKCTVTLLNEEESLGSYLKKDDTFFYWLKYDPQQRALNTDRGSIKIGNKYQVDEIPKATKTGSEPFADETLTWKPSALLTDTKLAHFTTLAKAVGLFARAVDVNSSIRSPSLHAAAIVSSRDAVLQYSHDLLEKHRGDVAAAIAELVPNGVPVLLRDQLEEWSPAEAALFEEGLDKYGKDFENIRADLLSWKSVRSLIEFYYMWKSTDRYQNRRRQKAADNENKMKQVYIPEHTKPNPALITANNKTGADGKPLYFCESCGNVESPAGWYAWNNSSPNAAPGAGAPAPGQPLSQLQQTAGGAAGVITAAPGNHKLCSVCWTYWKKYGGLKHESRLDAGAGRPDPGQRAERIQQMKQATDKKMVHCQVPDCNKVFRNRQQMLRHLYNIHEVYVTDTGAIYPMIKTPAAFVMTVTAATMLMRRLLGLGPVQLSRVPRHPCTPIDFAQVQKEWAQLSDSAKRLEGNKLRQRRRKPHSLLTGLRRIGIDLTVQVPAWLRRPTEGETKHPTKLAFPKPEHSPWPEDQMPLHNRKFDQPSIMRNTSSQHLNNSTGSGNGNATKSGGRPNSAADRSGSPAQATPKSGSKQPQSQHHGSNGTTPASTGGNSNNNSAGLQLKASTKDRGRTTSRKPNGNSRRSRVEHLWKNSDKDLFFSAKGIVIKARKNFTSKQLRKACRQPFFPIEGRQSNGTNGLLNAPR